MTETDASDEYQAYLERWRAVPLDTRPDALRRSAFNAYMKEYTELASTLPPREPGQPPSREHVRVEELRLLLLLET